MSRSGQIETACRNPGCEQYREVASASLEAFLPIDCCPVCAQPLEQVLFPVAVVFAGVMTARYNDSKQANADQEGHWMQEKKSPGGPKWTWVDNWQERKRIMKQEGLVDGGRAEISADGKSVGTSGMPGQWT